MSVCQVEITHLYLLTVPVKSFLTGTVCEQSSLRYTHKSRDGKPQIPALCGLHFLTPDSY